MYKPLCLLAVALTAFAEDKAAARRLLDSAAEMVSAASPEIQVASRMNIGLYYELLDREKAIRHFEEAFALTAALPEDGDTNTRTAMQAEVVKVLSTVDVPLAIEMIRRMAEPATKFGPRNEAITKVVEALIGKKDVDRAIEVVALIPAISEHPFDALGPILEKLPKDDPRRIVLFGNATKAYIAHSSGPFPAIVSRYWREVPKEMAQSAVDAIVKRLLDTSDKNVSASVVENEEKAAELQTWQTQQMVQIFDAMRSLDPKRAEEILETRPELRKAIARKPREVKKDEPDDDSDDVSPMALIGGITPEGDLTSHFTLWRRSTEKAREALAEMEKNPGAALRKAKDVPMASVRAELIARIARVQAKKRDAENAKATLDLAAQLIAQLKSASDRIMPRVAIAETAHELKDAKLAWDMLTAALADADEMYKTDANPKSPNTVIRDYWPSINGARLVAWRAVKLLGVDAEALLANAQNPDLLLVAKIDLAAGLLDKPASVRAINVAWSR